MAGRQEEGVAVKDREETGSLAVCTRSVPHN